MIVDFEYDIFIRYLPIDDKYKLHYKVAKKAVASQKNN